MKHSILKILTFIFAFPIWILNPVRYHLSRFYYMILAVGHLKNVDPSIQFDGPIYLNGTKKLNIGKYSRIGPFVEFETEEAGTISIGSNVRINRGCTICSYTSINIGQYTLIGEFTSIRDANHGTDMGQFIRVQKHKSKAINIGEDVWIGRGSCILPGVTIGKGSVVGANSVVTCDIPPYSIAVGAPAKVIKKRDKATI